MTIASTTSRNNYIGTGGVSVYPYTFKIFSATDLLVTQRDTNDVETTLVLTTDYTVDGVGATAGGNVTLTAGNLPSGETLAIRRVRPLTQATDIRNQGDFLPEVHEDAFDHFVMIAQQQEDEIDRCMRLSESFSPAVISTILPAPVALNGLRWNAGATGLENFILGSGTSIVLPGLSGMAVFTTPNSFSARTIVAGDSTITVTNGDGQAGNPSLVVALLGVDTPQLALDAVDATILQDDASVDANRSVTTNHIRDLAVTQAKIALLAVDTPQLALDAVDATILQDDASVDANRSVTTNHIRDLNVTQAKLALLSVDTGQLADGAVTADKLAAGARTFRVAVNTTLQDIQTTTETAIFSETIPANDMGTDGTLFVKYNMAARGSAPGTYTVRLKLGGTTVGTITGITAGSSGHIPIAIEGAIHNLTATTQRAELKVLEEDGTLNLDGTPAGAATHSIDTTSAQTLEITVELLGASASEPGTGRYQGYYGAAWIVA